MKYLRVQYVLETEEMVPVNSLNLDPGLLETLNDLGIIEKTGEEEVLLRDVRRIYRALRLKNCLDVDYSGAAIILDLLDRIEELEHELRRVRTITGQG